MNKFGLKIFVGIVVAAVVTVTVIGLWISGSPAQERARRIDAQRVRDLQSISYAVDAYWNSNDKNLPGTLTDLQNTRDYSVPSIVDPVTGAEYEYRQVTASGNYELCATFETDSAQDATTPGYRGSEFGPFWDHAVGRTCYQLEVHDNDVRF